MLLDTIPGVGGLLALTIAVEIGEIGRFPTVERLAIHSADVGSIKQGSFGWARVGGAAP